MSRTPITRVPSGRIGRVDAVKARPFRGSTAGRGPVQSHSNDAYTGNGGSFASLGLGFDHGDLRHGSIFLGRGDHHGGGVSLGISGHRGDDHFGSTYGQLYYDHRYSFYGPYQAYWSSAYYPNYAPLYGLGYGYGYAPYGYSLGPVYSYGPYYDAAYYAQVPYAADSGFEGTVAVEPSLGTADQVYGGSGASGESYGNVAGGASPPIASAPAAVQEATGDRQGWGPILGEGNVAFSQGRYEDARQTYARAMLIDERDGYAKMLFAWASFALGDYPLAATAVRRAMLTSPDLVQYPINVRLHYGDITALDHQVDALQRYVAAHPDDREADLLLGYVYYSIGDVQRALAVFNDLAQSDPADEAVNSLRLVAAATVQAELRGK